MKKVTVKASVKLPRLPNFLMMTDGQTLPISAVEEKSLREIGNAWVEALVHKSKETKNETE